MPVFALYNFDDAGSTALDSALGNGAQNGVYLNGAAATGGQAVFDGDNDIVKIYQDPSFQMDRGTLDISFTMGADPLTDTQTVLSRDSAGSTDGGYSIEIQADGSVVISHETATGTETFGTAPGFANPGDQISLSYSWDQGVSGGQLVIENATSGDTFSEAVPNTLTMDMSGQGINQPWIIGAGQNTSTPELLNNIDQFFQGSVTTFQLSDTVDNVGGPDGIVRGSVGNDVIDLGYIDPTDGDRVDANDAIIPGDAPNEDRIEAGAGNDFVIGGLGEDTINGDAGDDLLNGDGGGVVDSYDRAYPGDYTADIDPNNNRDLVYGGEGNDVLNGGDDADTLFGGSGADTIRGGIDDDSIVGGGGVDLADSLAGGQGRDTIEGGAGNDTIDGDDTNTRTHNAVNDGRDLDTENNRDLLSGGAGDDRINGGDDNDTLNGDAGNDDLHGGLDDDLLNGGDGDDALWGEQGNDLLNGGAGADALLGDVGNDTLNGGDANDTLAGESGNDVLNGDAGNDRINGGVGNDTMTGGADRDYFNGVNAGDVVDGSETGDDTDTLDLTGRGPLTIVYDPANGENGVVTFRDAAGNPTGTLSFVNIENVITDASGAPVAGDDTATTPEDTAVTIPVLGNDTDPDGQPLVVTTATSPNGTVTVNPDGTLAYTPNPDFTGTDTITYTVTDPDGNEDTATVTVTVTPVNDAPVAEDDASVTPLNTPVTYAVLGNDTDVDGDTLTIQGAPTSADGTVTVNADGTLTFTPTDGFTGAAVVNYTIVDEEGLTDTAQWTITVGDTGAPVAGDDTATTPEDTAVTIPVLGNDTDPDGQPLTVTAATSPNGTVTVNPDGTLAYTPNPDFTGTDTITYTVTDPDGNEDTATVTVTVTPVNDAPIAEPDTATTPVDTPVVISVLGNDSDPDGDDLAIVGVPTSEDGTVAINPDGTLTFTPNPGFVGVAVITYTIDDGNGAFDTTTVDVTVTEEDNRPPVAEDDVADTAMNTPVTIAILENDSDPDGDPIFIVGTPVSADGTVVVNPDGTITFTPNPDFVGDATINYLVADGYGGTDPAVVTVTVVDMGERDGIVRGTGGDDLIDATYPNDNDGDFVDAGDALLPGDAPQDDRILAGDGNDTVAAGRGDDSVEGGDGNDLINGANGDDTLFGQDGDDTLIGQNGDDTVYGGTGNDSVRGGSGDDLLDTRGDTTPLPDQDYPGIYAADDNPDDDHDTVRGGVGNDTIFTGDDADVAEGGDGNDLIDVGFDDDFVTGGLGNDTIIGAEGNDTIDAGQGDDLVYGGYGPGIPDAVNIPDSIDLRPANGQDSIVGGLGNDTIYGQDDDDTIDGGQDNDVIYGGIDEDSLRGNVGDDLIYGDQGNDTVSGGQGNDTITGGEGADLLSGDADRDNFVVGIPANGIGDTVYGGDGGDDFDRLIMSGAAPYRLSGVVADSDGNGIDGTVEFLDGGGNVIGTMAFTNIEEIVPCFTPGTLIATPKGEVPVEHLKAGDRVITRDNGIQEIRWTGAKQLGWHDLAANPHLKPVLIRQGSLGNGLPERDMMVSPNHRMLVANDRTALYFDEHEVLVSAKHLVAGQGIQSIDSVGTTYIHFMFDRHEVVLGNGAWTESFQPGDLTLKGMGNAQRAEIFELFPELKTDTGLNDYQAARRTLKKHEARLLVK